MAGDALVASQTRLTFRGQTAYDWQHYIVLVRRKLGALRNGAPFVDMPEPLRRLQQALLRHSGGDRVVLAAVPQAGLDAVLVAAELVLDGGTPSGTVSAEHVLNVLARLQAPPAPAQAETALQLKEAPKADAGRYDRLRGLSAPQVIGAEVRHG